MSAKLVFLSTDILADEVDVLLECVGLNFYKPIAIIISYKFT